MRTYDMSPLYRSTIGFDHLFKDLFDSVNKPEGSGYPPYNIELLTENSYRITLAVAGFKQDDIDVEITEQTLNIRGACARDTAASTYLHHGIAGRNFERRFQLAEHVYVTGASLENGLLNIELAREIPEAQKTRKIKIAGQRDTTASVMTSASDAA